MHAGKTNTDAFEQDLVLFVQAIRELVLLYCTSFDDLGTTDGMIRLAEAMDLALRCPHAQRADEALFFDLEVETSSRSTPPGDSLFACRVHVRWCVTRRTPTPGFAAQA